MQFYNLTPEQSLEEQKTTLDGLSSNEAQARLKHFGANAINLKSTPLWKKIVEPFLDIFVLVLAVAAAISAWHGDTLDAVIIVIIIAISAIIFYVQQFSTDRVLKTLSKKSAQTATVIRSKQATTKNIDQLVPGDIVLIGEGDKVAADLRIIKCSNLRVNESQLTGESLPVDKKPSALKGEKQIYERTNMLYQGSFVTSGTATALVIATGNDTELGNLASLSKNTEPKSPIQKKIDELIARIIAVVAGITVVAFGLALWRGMDAADSLRFVMALAVSAVPEGLPVAISVVLVLGMRRMAKKKALVTQMRAIETIGAITTIATDKTGTLTQNKLTVQTTWSPSDDIDLDDIISHAINKGGGVSFDPLDTALETYARRQKALPKAMPAHQLPFDQSMSMSATAWHFGTTYRYYVKGAPENIIKLAGLNTEDAKTAINHLTELTEKGYRVIGLATLETDKNITVLKGLTGKDVKFSGFVAVSDVLRPETKRAVSSALKAGVTVRMITGDHFETAYQIGKQLGMISERDEVFDCRAMSQMSDKELEHVVEKTRVFSRVIPEQKYRLLTILKKHNITAMTGDGVNDVPALANAHIGVAMGSGSHIAKDAGDIILLDDNFKTIIDAMKEGRTVISNVRRMLYYLLSTNAGELLTIIGALIVGIKMPLAPVQILWINLVTDTSMVIPLGLEPAEKNIMKQPPHKPAAPILSRSMIVRIIAIALTMAIIALIVYLVFEQTKGHAYAQTLVFTGLVVSQWANAFNARSDYESVFSRLKVMNRSFYVGLIISVGVQLVALFTPVRSALGLVEVNMIDMLLVSLASFVIPILVCEIHKAYLGRVVKI